MRATLFKIEEPQGAPLSDGYLVADLTHVDGRFDGGGPATPRVGGPRGGFSFAHGLHPLALKHGRLRVFAIKLLDVDSAALGRLGRGGRRSVVRLPFIRRGLEGLAKRGLGGRRLYRASSVTCTKGRRIAQGMRVFKRPVFVLSV